MLGGRLQGPRPLCVLRQRLGRHFNGASYDEGQATAGDFGQEGLFLLVATPWDGQAARKDFLLHESRRSNVRRRLLQVNPVYRWVAADSLVMTCLRRSGPTEISPVNGRL
jgi:hypothetical protein